ncbi:MAG: SAP domain-containing protein [Candidatus Hermodarchaeota archaeon]
MDIRDFLKDYFDLDDLKNFLDEKLGLPVSGTKDEVIERIVSNVRFHPKLIYEWLDKEEMKELCREPRLKVSGNKRVSWDRILKATNYFDDKFQGTRPKPKLAPGKTELRYVGSTPAPLVMEEYVIDPKIKPLLADFLELKIGDYLISERFRVFTKKMDLDDLWSQSLIYGEFDPFRTYVPNHEKAFEFFLNSIFYKGKGVFLISVSALVRDFLQWSNKTLNFDQIKQSLVYMGYTEDELDPIFPKIKEKFTFSFLRLNFRFSIVKIVIIGILGTLTIACILLWSLGILPPEIQNLIGIASVVFGFLVAIFTIPDKIKSFLSPRKNLPT